MTDNVKTIIPQIIRNGIDELADCDAELCELKHKYKIAITFIKNVKNQSCSLIDCMACNALDVLRELGE